MRLIDEFKPALIFLAKFLMTYVVGNLLYGILVESYNNSPDLFTVAVARQTAVVLDVFGYSVTTQVNPAGPTVFLVKGQRLVIDVFEGCNGLNVMIVFLSFLVAFGGSRKRMLWFVPAGIFVIHLFNLARLTLLYVLAEGGSTHFHYFHKYFFTAILYVCVFGLWALWIKKIHGQVGVSRS